MRAANGPAPFRAFVEALRRYPAGVEYELVLAFKGFRSQQDAEPYMSEVSDIATQALFFDDTGFDLGVYIAAVNRLQRARYCFLNSFSQPLVDGWLAKLDAALALNDVGMAAASGSWFSSRSWMLYSLGMPSHYRRLLPPRKSMREQFAQLDDERAGVDGAGGHIPASASVDGVRRFSRAAIDALSALPACMRDYEPFPAQHLRTNAFTIAHSTLAELQLRHVREKSDAYVLESGRDNLTRQIQRFGLRAVIVDRSGEIYDPDQWHHSRTFWQGSQEGLLVADNQTCSYERGGAERRRLLSTMAWGDCADPSPALGG